DDVRRGERPRTGLRCLCQQLLGQANRVCRMPGLDQRYSPILESAQSFAAIESANAKALSFGRAVRGEVEPERSKVADKSLELFQARRSFEEKAGAAIPRV